MKKKYYKLTTSMTFQKTVLVPVESVKDVNEAIDLVDCGVEVASIDLLNEEAECETKIAEGTSICELTEEDASLYQVICNDAETAISQ